ncbi:Zinc metalloproteinase nas-29 [Caenorhabditis elegans]|uniref:Zinc metalloproteinase nas-29 n=1 Tax=Caenorhabditis elegans TaxID=6239 RepID=NAS29_CAEEL|nr:Zinc metalloproteinase nas-29 [Caenorhabditis elegans]Q20958.4 RecName: Full=Zinc metalloproteinase nas-29; AltName: Full=Nematode astacin 29; Flags: Precursor [Caenorhabditis elegans]CCD65842.1 Zinc metalloproteinase nas-29 [Caenorhabditis elegans]|eukprot:NP_494953.3 Zinc metalloproteinase nas-29 [Caenorhabditis elegans]
MISKNTSFCGFLILVLATCMSAQFVSNESIKLHDILKPSATHRLFDTLQYSVEEQYSDSHLSFDVSTIYNYSEKPISIGKLNKKYRDILFEGDMAISYKQLSMIVNGSTEYRKAIKSRRRGNKINGESTDRTKRQAYLDNNYPATIWKNGVAFMFHESLTPIAKTAILKAVHFWYRETCIEFHPRTFQKEYLLFIGNDDGCWSTVGRDASQGKQVVSIGNGCEHFGVTSHELAHALGIFHEQSRFDRDESVVFNPRVVERDLLFNFAKISPRQMSTYGLPYDIGSVMHYTPTEFSNIPSIPTLAAIDTNLQQTMGQLEGPSFVDVHIMNQHYQCQEKCPTQAPCQNGGFTNSRNCKVCKCPTGFGGAYCQLIASSFSPFCGGYLNAEETTRRFDITIRQSTTTRSKTCVYHIKAPEGKRIIIDILKIDSKCIEGCWQDGLELKMKKDFRPVGYRFCCPESSRRKVISEGNMVPFMVFSKEHDFSVSFEYSFVSTSAGFDDEKNDSDVIVDNLDGVFVSDTSLLQRIGFRRQL